MKIARIDHLPDDIDTLLIESQQQGFRFLKRLKEDFLSDRMRFDGPGEGLFTLRAAQELVGIGGITRVTDALFRLRRVYVADALRGRGAGRLLIERLEAAVPSSARVIELHTDTLAATRFYDRLGYGRCESARRSHLKILKRR